MSRNRFSQEREGEDPLVVRPVFREKQKREPDPQYEGYDDADLRDDDRRAGFGAQGFYVELEPDNKHE
jgi:hypothetical protein